MNNASGFASSDDEAGWAVSVAVDMMAIVHATQAALPFLKEAKGCVVNTSSISALRTAARQPPYGAIKAAAIHYTMTQAAMYAKDGIRVNGVAPGSIEFPGGVWDRRKSDNPNLYNAILRSIPFGRLGHPEEVANVVLFLASPYASWITGSDDRGGRRAASLNAAGLILSGPRQRVARSVSVAAMSISGGSPRATTP